MEAKVEPKLFRIEPDFLPSSKPLMINKDIKHRYTPNVNNKVSINTILKICFMKR